MRDREFVGDCKQHHCLTYSKLLVELFFLNGSNPATAPRIHADQAVYWGAELCPRGAHGIRDLLTDPDAPIRHQSPRARCKDWFFWWTEFRAEQVGDLTLEVLRETKAFHIYGKLRSRCSSDKVRASPFEVNGR
jgi:hypothetical protein